MSMPSMIGDNHPPSPIEMAKKTRTAVANFLQDMPVVTTDNDARQTKLIIDRAKASLDEMEDARKREVGPLNLRVSTINESYKAASRPLTALLDQLKSRLAAYIRAEQERREREAEAARQAALEAERIAREAEQREREAIDNAAVGECADVGAAIEDADSAFNDFAKADRTATRAERDMHVKIGGGFRRAASLRTVETLVLVDPFQAIKAIGTTAKIREAILSSARDYRKLNGELPAGVRATHEQAF